MKALSVRQPWAWMIIYAGKDIENRTWSTRYRGPLLIHAAKGMTREEYIEGRDFAAQFGCALPAYSLLKRGGIVGSVKLVDCVAESVSPWFFGPFGFVLAEPIEIPFTPFRGRLGLFEVAV